MKARGIMIAKRPHPAAAFGNRRIAWVCTRQRLVLELLETAPPPKYWNRMIRRISKVVRQIHRAPEVLRCRSVTPQWWPLTRAYIGVSKLQYPFELRLRSGTRLSFADFYDVTTFWQIFIHETYAVNPRDTVIVDAGANIGSFSLYALATAPAARVVAIEPFPSTFDRLRRLLDTQCEGARNSRQLRITGKAGDGHHGPSGSSNPDAPCTGSTKQRDARRCRRKHLKQFSASARSIRSTS